MPCQWGKNGHYSFAAVCLVVFLTHNSNGIPAVTLGSGENNEFDIPSSVCYDDNLPEEFGGNYTICAFVKPSARELPSSSVLPDASLEEPEVVDSFDGILFTVIFNQSYTEASFAESRLTVSTQETKYTFDAQFESDIWRKICITFKGEKVTASVGDHQIGLILEESTNATEEISESFCIGAADNTSFTSFSGTVAALFLNIEDGDDEKFNSYSADCSNLMPSDAFLSLDSTWKRSGYSTHFNLPAIGLCTEAFTLITINMFEGQKPHMTTCASINGRLLTEGEVSDSLFQTRIEYITQSCNLVNNNHFWIAGNATGVGMRRLCPTGTANGTAGMMPCISELYCSVCVLPTSLPFTMYGKVFTIDRSFTLVSLDNGDFYLKGKDASEIRYNGSHWVMQSELHTHKWHLTNAVFPTGRNLWQAGEHENVTLTVTQCNQGQYACNSSDCISREDRCNGYIDCKDGSDEKNCENLELSETYSIDIDPAVGLPQKGYVEYDLFVYAVGNINILNGMAKMDISLALNWYDPRIKYWNVKKNTRQFLPCERLWTPVINAYAADEYAAETNVLSRKCYLSDVHSEDLQIELEDHQMGEYVDGSKLYAYNDINLLVEFPCHFKLQRYPFGTHECNVTLYIRNCDTNLELKSPNPDDDNAYFEGKDDLQDFKLLNITHTVDDSYLTITLHLESLFDYHLLSSFAPSALMFFVSVSTFFFPMEDFNERIMVSLTSLLVLAALFTQASDSSVKTPYYKLIDVWYAAMIALCFIVVILVTCVNSSRATKKSSSMRMKVSPSGTLWDPDPKRFFGFQSKTDFYNKLSISLILTLFAIFILFYILSATHVI